MSNAEDMEQILNTPTDEIRSQSSDQVPDTLVITEERLRQGLETEEKPDAMTAAAERVAEVQVACRMLGRIGLDFARAINEAFSVVAEGLQAQVVIGGESESDESEQAAGTEQPITTVDQLRESQERRRQQFIERSREMPATKAMVELIYALLGDSGSTLVSIEGNPLWDEIEYTALKIREEIREVRAAAEANQGLIDAKRLRLFSGKAADSGETTAPRISRNSRIRVVNPEDTTPAPY